MSAKCYQNLFPNTVEFESLPLVLETGFREYDARWLFEKEINLYGVQTVGQCLGTMICQKTGQKNVVVAHDFRSYSAAIKNALIIGLMEAGCHVHDIGLAITPIAYFAQFELGIPAVAMVTASHNENGWTGIKMGLKPALTFGPQEMLELKTMVINGEGQTLPGGSIHRVHGVDRKYKEDLLGAAPLTRRLKVAVVCGNGTAGAFAPQILREFGCEVVEIDCKLDHSFPNYNPNPEDLIMLRAMANAVISHHCDLGFAFDGDGDRLGVVDHTGHEIFSDKLGLLIARDIVRCTPNAKFVVDVKSTGLFKTDVVLKSNGAVVDYWKTGHSYIKQRTQDIAAVAGFEKSGHFFLRPPFGRGYDDGVASALLVCRMLENAGTKSLRDLYLELPNTYSSPTMSPHCPDSEKYGVVAEIAKLIETAFVAGAPIDNQVICEINLVNGVRFELQDGSFGLVRASSNKPELVVVCESVASTENLQAIFTYIERLLAKFPVVGRFNQKI